MYSSSDFVLYRTCKPGHSTLVVTRSSPEPWLLSTLLPPPPCRWLFPTRLARPPRFKWAWASHNSSTSLYCFYFILRQWLPYHAAGVFNFSPFFALCLSGVFPLRLSVEQVLHIKNLLQALEFSPRTFLEHLASILIFEGLVCLNRDQLRQH